MRRCSPSSDSYSTARNQHPKNKTSRNSTNNQNKKISRKEKTQVII